MRTIGNNIPFTGAEYNSENDTAEYFDKGFTIATYNYNNGEFEDLEGLTDDQWESVRHEMDIARESHNELI